ncbi:hypothetical protein [Neorickettsia helminthoeca]|uniref:hypothetical protein n=1 Tax=Neorickettsia helminthoeca TaxID=33994 RepID=UPI0005707655|nr:hypothetical protein [Neorickettsia helminthoeca]
MKLSPKSRRRVTTILEVLFITTIKVLVLPLNLLYVKNKIDASVFILCAVALQLLVSFSALYSSYRRRCISCAMEDASAKADLLLSKSATSFPSCRTRKSFNRNVFIAEILMQIASGVGLAVTPFCYKSGKLDMWVYMGLMVVFLVMGSFYYFVISVERVESRESITRLNEILDLLLQQKQREANCDSSGIAIEVVAGGVEKTLVH